MPVAGAMYDLVLRGSSLVNHQYFKCHLRFKIQLILNENLER